MKILHIAETAKGGVSSIINSITGCIPLEHAVLIPKTHCKYVNSDNKYTFWGSRGFSRVVAMLCMTVYVVCKEKPNLIHLHSSFSILMSPLLFILGFVFNFKIYYQPHGVSYDPQNNKSKLERFFFKVVEVMLCKLVHKIIAISNYEKKLLIDAHVNSKVVMIYNPVQIGMSNNIGNLDEKYYLFVGRFDEQKGLDRLLDFWSGFNGSKLVVVGESVLNSNVRQENLTNVEFVNWVCPDELVSYYSNATALIMPSRWEGFGLVAIESLACGTPVISSNRGALPELIDDGVDGYIFDFEDFNFSIESKIKKLELLDENIISNNAVIKSKLFSLDKYSELLKYEYVN
ncbi:glycosyltransferase family 4 protein [Vibrio splendidus]|uniref:glycosyltransferase family 4 protein n=1 Tax=Vibrio splendidus TaxID=29497 RepID=UPI000C82AA8A|nr:glycosyltransferase family 4 protein [Vibrio splendidus]PMI53761.1 hypothetical protein BCU42_20210 [Vibrio splendidus]